MYVLLSVVTFVVLLAALIDIVTRPDDQVKHLPKWFWIVLVILLPFVGSILWVTVGREWGAAAEAVSFGDRRRWDRSASATPAPAPQPRALTTEEQLEALEREAEFYEKQARLRRLEAERDAQRTQDS